MTGGTLRASWTAGGSVRRTGSRPLATHHRLRHVGGLCRLQTDLSGLRRWLLLDLDGGSRGTSLYKGCTSLLTGRHHQTHGRGVDLSDGAQLSIGTH